MERSKDDVQGTSIDLEVCVKNLPEDLSELLPILDVDELLTRIQAIYKDIIQKTPKSDSFFENFLDTPLMPSKSKDQADKYREEQHVFIRAKKFREALLSITQSIAFAEEDSEELATAYFHRSYILFKLEKYNSCIQDVDRAAQIVNCPVALEEILRDRRKRCLKLQKRIKRDEEENLNLEWYKSCNLRPSHSNLPNTSPKLELDSDEKRERHLIAIEDIQPGEILSVEDFYVTGLYSEKLYAYCSFCLLECDTLIPCSTCTWEMYCSEKCQSQAFSLFHQSECKFIGFYEHKLATIETRLAIRMFLIGVEQGKQLENLTKELEPRDVFSGKYDQDSRFDGYRSTLQFRRIYQVDDTDVQTAVCIIIVLIRSSFFGNGEVLPNRLSFVQSYAALLLINHLTTLRMVHPTVETLLLWKDPADARDTESIPAVQPKINGFGISLLQNSLIRRSCSANTSSFQQNRQRIAFATRKIRAGEKLSTNSMIYKFPDLVKQYRAESESHYTVCEIDACSTVCTKIELLEDKETPFPLYSSLKTEIMTLTVKACTEVRRAMTQAKVLRNKEILKVIIEYSNSLRGILATPSYSIVLCEQLLVVFMKLLYCEHQQQYKDLSLENYIINLLNFIARRIYVLEGTNFAPKN